MWCLSWVMGIIIVVSLRDVCISTLLCVLLSVNLSFLDISFTTSIVPQLLVNLWGPQKAISYGGCDPVLYLPLVGGNWMCPPWQSWPTIAMCCHLQATPLHCHHASKALLQPGFCLVAWGSDHCMVGSTLTMLLPLCGNNRIDHFFCEMPLIMQLACVDTSFNEVEMYVPALSLLSCLWVSFWSPTAVLPGLCWRSGQQKGGERHSIPARPM